MCSVIFIVYTRVEAGPVGKCDDVFCVRVRVFLIIVEWTNE